MSAERTSPPQIVLDLIERFERNRESHKSPQYNETRYAEPPPAPTHPSLAARVPSEYKKGTSITALLTPDFRI